MVPYGLEDSSLVYINADEVHEIMGTEKASFLWKMKNSEGDIVYYKHHIVPHMREDKKGFRRKARQAAKYELTKFVESYSL